MFVKVTHSVLLMLQEMGYSILKSVSPLRNDNPSFYPLKIKNIDGYLIHKDKMETANKLLECHIIVIEDALNYTPNEWLIGQVFLEPNLEPSDN